MLRRKEKISTMTIYFVVLTSCIILGYLAEKNDSVHENQLSVGTVSHSHTTRNLFIVIAIILIVVAGFRFGNGGDFWSYYDAIQRYSKEFAESIKTLNEPGIRLIYTIIGWITKQNIVPIFVCSFITISMMLIVIYRHTDKLMMAVLLFLFLGCWHESFNAVRQCLAAAIVFSGYGFIQEKKFFKYLIVVIIAFLFHRSAILMIAPFFVYQIKISPKSILLIILGIVIALYSFDRVFSFSEWIMQDSSMKLSNYANRQMNPFRIAVAIAPALYYLFISAGKERSKTEDFYLSLLIVHAVVMVVSSQSALMGRFGVYTAPFCAIAIPELNKLEYSKIKTKSGYVISGGVIICILFFAFWIYDISKDPTLNNYEWYWSNL